MISELIDKIQELDVALRPLLKREVDINSPDWMDHLKKFNPVEELGIENDTLEITNRLIYIYTTTDSKVRNEVRNILKKFDSFSWALNVKLDPITSESVRNKLIIISMKDQASDPRDEIMAINSVIEKAKNSNIEIRPYIEEVARISSTEDLYGFGSMNEIFQRTKC